MIRNYLTRFFFYIFFYNFQTIIIEFGFLLCIPFNGCCKYNNLCMTSAFGKLKIFYEIFNGRELRLIVFLA